MPGDPLSPACTEVESHWRSILRANDYRCKRPTTQDFVKLAKPLRLEEYAVTLPLFPNLPLCKPFLGWSAASPSKSLDWYEAYNATKHDREQSLASANLQRTINAVAACAVMIEAQFGPTEAWSLALNHYFEFHGRPQWDIGQVYYALGSPEWRAVPLRFSTRPEAGN